MIAVADSSFVIAVALHTDKAYSAASRVYHQHSKIYLPQSTLAESCYLITREGGNRATARFLRVIPDSRYSIVSLEVEDFLRAADILDQYADSRVDFVDATIVAVAERLNITRILTLDQRDFHIIRPTHAPHFELLPQAQ
jgi:predicted nucleic acid-binding protein